MNTKLLPAVLPLFMLISSAMAEDISTDIMVTGEVANSCTITAPSSVDFGAMAPNEVKTQNAQISVTCNNGAAYTIKPHNTGTVTVTGTLNGTSFSNSETMTGVSVINVQIGSVALFKDLSATQPWSDAAPISGTGIAASQTHDIAFTFSHDGVNFGNFSFTLRPTITF